MQYSDCYWAIYQKAVCALCSVIRSSKRIADVKGAIFSLFLGNISNKKTRTGINICLCLIQACCVLTLVNEENEGLYKTVSRIKIKQWKKPRIYM